MRQVRGVLGTQLNLYDIAAGDLIVREAGGTVTDFRNGFDYPAHGLLPQTGLSTLNLSTFSISRIDLFRMDSKPNIAKVVVNLSLDKVFDYSIPPELVGILRIGMRVNVPFGHGERLAYIVSFAHSSSHDELKSIISICDNHPSIPDSLIKLAEWISDYYCCAREQSVKALLPGAVRSGKVKAKTRAYYSVRTSLLPRNTSPNTAQRRRRGRR
jgi:hypothetical protein